MKRFFVSMIACLLITIICSFCFGLNNVSYAEDESSVITAMQNATSVDSSINGDTGVGGAVNIIIGLIQIAGTGIAVITVTLLGGKYMLSSPEQKAEIKNRAMPVVIGMVILFGAVNMVAIVANLANEAIK